MKIDNQRKVIDPQILLEEYRRILAEEETVEALPLVISGNSMSPFLIHGRDTVYLSRLTRPVRRGDVLLYQRRSGTYVLHRVYAVTDEGFTMVGDAQTVLEPGIRQSQVIAVMTRAVRKGKKLEPGDFWWDFFEKIWIHLVSVRPALWASCMKTARMHGVPAVTAITPCPMLSMIWKASWV